MVASIHQTLLYIISITLRVISGSVSDTFWQITSFNSSVVVGCRPQLSSYPKENNCREQALLHKAIKWSGKHVSQSFHWSSCCVGSDYILLKPHIQTPKDSEFWFQKSLQPFHIPVRCYCKQVVSHLKKERTTYIKFCNCTPHSHLFGRVRVIFHQVAKILLIDTFVRRTAFVGTFWRISSQHAMKFSQIC